MDVSDENTYFEWKVSNDLIQQWKSAKCEKTFFSPEFNAVGVGFYLGIYPNGNNIEGTARLYMRSTDKKEIVFGYYIGIEAFNHYEINFKENKIKKGASFSFNSPFEWNDIQNKSEITIGIKIWEGGSIENNEARLISSIYSKMMKLHGQYSKKIDNFQNKNAVLEEGIEQKSNQIARMESITLNLNSEITSLKREKQATEDKLKEFAMRD
eukprot:324587_1